MSDKVMIKETESVETLRQQLTPEINDELSDFDCKRFLIARNFNIKKTTEMVKNWYKWWYSPLTEENPICPYQMLDLDHIEDPKEEIFSKYCPHTFQGFDKEGRPLYWELSGLITQTFPELEKEVSFDELLIKHIRAQELLTAMRELSSKKIQKPVEKMNVILDLQDIVRMPDWLGLKYTQKMLEIDQAYYPERLHRIYVINSPWYFSALYSMISPWLDPNTAGKVKVLSQNYLKVLQDINDDQIPEKYGGTMKVEHWHWPYHESCGISPDQLRKRAETKEKNQVQINISNSYSEKINEKSQKMSNEMIENE